MELLNRLSDEVAGPAPDAFDAAPLLSYALLLFSWVPDELADVLLLLLLFSDVDDTDDMFDEVGDVFRRRRGGGGGGGGVFVFKLNSSEFVCSLLKVVSPLNGCGGAGAGMPILALNILLYEYVE